MSKIINEKTEANHNKTAIAPARKFYTNNRRHNVDQTEMFKRIALLTKNKIINLKMLHKNFPTLNKSWNL